MNNNGMNGTVGAGALTPAAALAVVAQIEPPLPPTQDITAVSIGRDPAVVLAEAQRAAAALKDVISRKERPVFFNGEQYLEFEDWQTMGRFYGVTARVREGSTKYVEYGDVVGFEAVAEAYHAPSDRILSVASASCLRDEPKWNQRAKYRYENGKKQFAGYEPVPLFQLCSMAQTRACAKAMRQVLSWVVVLAGYRATPAEEMPPNVDQNAPADPSWPAEPPPTPRRTAAAPPPPPPAQPQPANVYEGVDIGNNPPPPPAQPQPANVYEGVDIGNNPPNSRAAQQYVASRKITEMTKRQQAKAEQIKPWKTHGEFLALCMLLRERVGETTYAAELDLAGVRTEHDFINRQDLRGALQFYARLSAIYAEQERMQ